MSKGEQAPVTEGAPMDWEVLARFMAGESPADEADGVRAWLAENPARHDVLRALDRTLAPVAAPPAGLDVEAALRRVRARMDAPETPVIPFRAPAARPAPPPRSPAPGRRAPAAVALPPGGGLRGRPVRGAGSPLVASSTAVASATRCACRTGRG